MNDINLYDVAGYVVLGGRGGDISFNLKRENSI